MCYSADTTTKEITTVNADRKKIIAPMEQLNTAMKTFRDRVMKLMRDRTPPQPFKAGDRVSCNKGGRGTDKDDLIYGTVMSDPIDGGIVMWVKGDDGSEKMWSIIHSTKVKEDER